MFGRAVAFVPLEAVLRVARGQGVHLRVAGGFGQDGGGGNGGDFGVAFDDGFGGGGQAVGDAVAVDEDVLRRHGQGFDGAAHGQHGGVQDVEAGDFVHAGFGHAPRHGLRFDLRGQRVAFFLAEFFRVGQAGQIVMLGQDDGGGEHAAGQRAAPRFVHARAQKRFHVAPLFVKTRKDNARRGGVKTRGRLKRCRPRFQTASAL